MPYLLLFFAVLLAFASAGFSVIGFTSVFSSDWLIVLSSSAVELSKLVLVSFLFREFRALSTHMRFIASTLVVLLLLFTAVGTYGYLTSSYLTASKSKTLNQSELVVNQSRLTELKKQLTQYQSEITAFKSATSKISFATSNKESISKISDSIKSLEDKNLELTNKITEAEAHIGPMIQVAKVLNADLDRVVFAFILLFMLVLDPMAITLTIAYNHLKIREKENTNSTSQYSHQHQPMISEVESPITEPTNVIKPGPPIDKMELHPNDDAVDTKPVDNSNPVVNVKRSDTAAFAASIIESGTTVGSLDVGLPIDQLIRKTN